MQFSSWCKNFFFVLQKKKHGNRMIEAQKRRNLSSKAEQFRQKLLKQVRNQEWAFVFFQCFLFKFYNLIRKFKLSLNIEYIFIIQLCIKSRLKIERAIKNLNWIITFSLNRNWREKKWPVHCIAMNLADCVQYRMQSARISGHGFS